jgi:hypothetical protein
MFKEDGFRSKIICYVKDESKTKIYNMTSVFKMIMNCDHLGIQEPFERVYFVDVFKETMPFPRLANMPLLMKR